MKTKLLFFLCFAALFFACNGPNETVLPQTEQKEVAVVAETGTLVTEAQAADVAEAFFRNQAGDGLATRSKAGSFGSPSSIKSIEADAGTPAMYVMNYPGGGFALVSATRDYYPVLAYSDEGSFELSSDMGPVEVWIEETKEAIRTVELLDAETKASIRSAWCELEPASAQVSAQQTRAGYDPQMYNAFQARSNQLYVQYGPQGWSYVMSLADAGGYLGPAYDGIIGAANSYGSPIEYTIVGIKYEYPISQTGPFTTTKWNQRAPYNNNCNGQAVGCVPIAIAQIMKTYGKPASYDWSNMPNFLPANTSSQTVLSQFLKIAGNRAGIVYTGPNGDSGATPQQAKSAFESFGYTATLSNHNSTAVTNWLINERKPVYMRGRTSSDGHAWVCDGVRVHQTRVKYFVEFINPQTCNYYSSSGWTPANPGEHIAPSPLTYFNMNWGWADSNDGWYTGENVITGSYNWNIDRMNIYAKPR